MHYWTATLGNDEYDEPARVVRIKADKRADADAVWNLALLMCRHDEWVTEVKRDV